MFQIGEFWNKHSDFITKSFRMITVSHSMVHDGKLFRAISATPSLDPAASYVFSFTTGNTGKYAHMTPVLVSSTDNIINVVIKEGATITGGSVATAINFNRNVTTSTMVTIKKGVTISVEGTVTLADYTVGSGGNPSNSAGGSVESGVEFILKPNTTYTLAITNIGTVTATVARVSLQWYETLH